MRREVFIILMLLISSIILPVIGLYIGGNAKSITFVDTTNFILKGTTGNEFKDFLLRDNRLPPILGAIIIGLTLSGAGLMLQTLFRNLLASPYTTGITSGVLLIASLVIFVNSVSGLLNTMPINDISKILLAGWIGGLFAMIMLLVVASRVEEVNGVIIVALLLSYFFGGVRDYLIANAEEIQIQQYWEFIVGSLTRIHLDYISPMGKGDAGLFIP